MKKYRRSSIEMYFSFKFLVSKEPRPLNLCYWLFFGIFFLNSKNSICQTAPGNHVIDSLWHLIASANNDTVLAKLHIRIANAYGWNRTDSQIVHAETALAISKKNSFPKGLFLAYHTLAGARYVTGEYGKGLNEAKEGLKIARQMNNAEWISMSCNSIGLLYLQTGKFTDAIGYFEDELKYAEKTSDSAQFGICYNNLANCYLSLKEFRKSLEIRKNSVRIRKNAGLTSALADSYNDIGETYIDLGLNDSALYFLEKCLAIKQDVHDDEMCAVAAMNMGFVYINLGTYDLAKEYLNKSYAWSEKIGSVHYQYTVLRSLAEVARLEGKSVDEAVILRQMITLKDTIYNEENRKEVNQLQAEFDSEKKELQIKTLEVEQDNADKRNLMVIIFSAAGFGLLITFLVVVNNRFRITKKQKNIIEEQKLIVEEKQKEILDSIHYAKRIQQSLLPTEKYIERSLNKPDRQK